MSHLNALRAIERLANCQHPLRPIDPDLAREAGMDGNLARLLQAARDLDAESMRRADEDPVLRDVLG